MGQHPTASIRALLESIPVASELMSRMTERPCGIRSEQKSMTHAAAVPSTFAPELAQGPSSKNLILFQPRAFHLH